MKSGSNQLSPLQRFRSVQQPGCKNESSIQIFFRRTTQLLSQVEPLTPDAQQETGGWRALQQGFINIEQRVRTHIVGAVADLAVRRELAETERSGGGQAGVRKQNQAAILQVENLFRLQLKTDQAFISRLSRMIELFNQQWAECIITPAGVAIS